MRKLSGYIMIFLGLFGVVNLVLVLTPEKDSYGIFCYTVLELLLGIFLIRGGSNEQTK